MPRYNKCINPFKALGVKGHKGGDLRRPSENLCKIIPSLFHKSLICSKCRMMATKQATSSQSTTSHSPCHLLQQDDNVEMENNDDNNTCDDDDDDDFIKEPISRQAQFEEMMENLKLKFADSNTTHAERICILTITPKSWSERQLAKEFNTSRRMAKTAKTLVSTRGVFSFPTVRPGRKLSDETVQAVHRFYEDDENSRIMPGMKDTVSIKVNGEKVKLQKRLVLCNLRELYRLYVEKYVDNSIGFSKFATLRPPNCVLAGASGTHSVCVCTYHQNFKLMVDAAHLLELTANSDEPLRTYKDCITSIVCLNPTENCYFDECKSCPGVEPLVARLANLFEKAEIEYIQFQKWQTVDRSTLLTQTLKVHEFIDEFSNCLSILKSHHFIAKQQAAYVSSRKETLQRGEVLVHMDFSENYAFVAQDAAQSFHFNNNQCSVHPVVYYYRDEQMQLKHKSLVVLSDCLHHDTSAVYLAQKIVIDHIKSTCFVEKVIYVTDGAAQQYKNRFQFVNLMWHEEEFGLKAEWHFFATAHGKGACDGIGAILKRGARRASLQITSGEPILTPDALFQWAKRNLKQIDVFFVAKQEYEATKQSLQPRFATAKTIPATQKCHSFIPKTAANGEKKLEIRRISNSANFFTFPQEKLKKGRKSNSK